ncbi:hypothetical protein CDL15_Pgr010110 [Punica granatum]|uniref:Uncharacterized protein n=1 Tax=Punica granatum TaxID=22663 RepID=A0A218WY99_PUNGR|nr:hypothetical protein CDL15_Pgr010110 [Punica granatum]
MAEKDRVDISEEVNPPAPAHSQPPPTPAGMLPAYSGAPPTHLQPPTSLGAPLARTSQTSSASDDQARIAALEGTVNQMATSMAELLALLMGPNRASSSSTPPPGQGPTADPTPWVPPTQAPENMEGTLDGPSSDSDDTPAAPSVVYAVTEEHPSGVHIRLAQENEELENWTSVSRYSAVIADV